MALRSDMLRLRTASEPRTFEWRLQTFTSDGVAGKFLVCEKKTEL